MSIATKRVLSPALTAPVTRLAAADTARSNASSSLSAATVSSTTVQRFTPSSAVSFTIISVERADAFQLMRRRSSPTTYSRSEWNSLPDWP